MVYYLGSEFDAPLTAAWSKVSPSFHVSEPEPGEMVVREHLSFPHIRYLGASTGCGCGFRRDLNGQVDIDPAEAADSQADHEALVAYLRALPQQTRPMQIYGCWSGDESEPPEHFRTCSISELASPDFAFRERELITLAA